MTLADNGGATWPARIALALAVTASVIVLAMVQWRAGLLLTNDGPQRLYVAHVLAHLDDPAFGFAPFWQKIPTLTAHGFMEIVTLLDGPLGWERAYRIALVVTVEAWALAAFLLIAVAHPTRGWLGLLAFPMAHQWSFYLGFTPYLLGTALGLVVVALLVRVQRVSRRVVLVFVAAVLAVASLHLLAACFLAAAATVLAFGRSAERRWREAGTMALAAAPILIAFFVLGADGGGGDVPWEWLPPWQQLGQVATHLVPGPPWRAGIGLVALGLGLWGLVEARGVARVLGVIGLCFVAGSWVLPFTGSWQLVSPRALAWALPFLIAAAPIELLRARTAVIACAAIGIWCAAAFAWTAAFHDGLRARADRWLAFVELGAPAAPAVVRVPVILLDDAEVPEVPAMDPVIHLGHVAGTAWGGFMAYTQTGMASAHPIAAREQFEQQTFRAPDPRLIFAARTATDALTRRARVGVVAAEAAPADEVIVLGRREDIAVFEERGYVARGRGPSWFVGAVPKCSVKLEVSGLGHEAGIAVGSGGSDAPSRQWGVTAGTHALALDLPCGPLWLAVLGVRCAGGLDGRVLATATPDVVTELRCAVVP